MENIFYIMANLAASWITLLSHAYDQIGYQSIYTQLVPIVFKAQHESYIETLGVLAFFLMLFSSEDKNDAMFWKQIV